MAREYAPLLVSIGQDDDVTELTPTAQWLYMRLTARPEVSYAGVTQLNLRKWARMSRHITVAEVEKAYGELLEARFLVADDDEEYADEVLIRSLMRSGEMFKQPNVMRGACKAAQGAESPAVRRAIATELRRMLPLVHEKAADEVRHTIVLLDPEGPSPEPAQEGFPEGFHEPLEEPHLKGDGGTPVGEGSTEEFAEPPDTDTGTGTSVTSPPKTADDDTSPCRGGSGGSASRKRSADDKGHKLPEDWWPNDDDLAWYRENCPTLALEANKGTKLTEEFRDYWWSKAGKDARKTQWSRTWRNRMRDREERAVNQRARYKPDAPAARPSTSDAAARQAQSLRRGPRPKKPGDASGSPPRLATSNGHFVIDYDRPESA